MRFNTQKCYILSTATSRKQTPYLYQLNGEILQCGQCLAFVRHNLKYCPEKLRRLSYISLIRSKLEYSSSVWDPHLRKDIHQLEMVQRRAARFIKHDYSYDSSVSQMLKDLDLSSLENRRKMNKLTLLYKIRNNLLCIKENGYLERADHALVTPAEIINQSQPNQSYIYTHFSSTLQRFGINYQV